MIQRIVMGESKLKLDKRFWTELLRFLVVGLYGTLIDFVCEVWITSMANGLISSVKESAILAFLVQFLISVIGFLIGTPATWSLSSVWAFRDSEKAEENKSAKGALRFTLWAFAALLGGAIIQFLGYMICYKWSGWNINILDISFSTLFSSSINVFWCYTVVFVAKTAFTTIFNYLTRKFIIYKTK